MSNDVIIERIGRHKLFRELAIRRSRLAWSLTMTLLICYFILIGLVTSRPAFLREPVTSDSVTNVGIVLAVALMSLGWISTWIYIRSANAVFDTLRDRLLNEVRDES
jgi:uncharacterized membrane protein (DUF485 family)